MAQKDVALSWFVMAQQKSEINSLRTSTVKLSCSNICGISKEILVLIYLSPTPPTPPGAQLK